jgi:dUTP pyrophosphatase|tara:strand:+ start:632 stop:1159 length:528 start_codon:yes stop_codon:yes gene_type:complete
MMMSKTKAKDLKFYKINPSVKDPFFATEGSACFDIHANFDTGDKYSVNQDTLSKTIFRPVKGNSLNIFCMERVLVPTGLIFDIPEGYSVRLHSRSGLAWKDGIYLTNCEGIIDSDYVDPVFVMMTNISQSPKSINNGDRVCQAELVEKIYHGLTETKTPPVQKTEREGGFGSTGK